MGSGQPSLMSGLVSHGSAVVSPLSLAPSAHGTPRGHCRSLAQMWRPCHPVFESFHVLVVHSVRFLPCGKGGRFTFAIGGSAFHEGQI